MCEAQELDARGLLCPMPVIRAQDAIKKLPQGATLHLTATDPGTLHDIPAWCRIHGHEVSVEEQPDQTWRFVITVGAAS